MARKPPLVPLVRAARLFAVLGNEDRLHIMLRLARQGDQDVEALAQACSKPEVTLAYHLRILRLEGVIQKRRAGASKVFSICSDVVRQWLEGIES